MVCLICHTFTYDFLHHSRIKRMHPFTPLKNDANTILMFDTNPYTSSRTHKPITIQMTRVKYLFFPFRIVLLITHFKKMPRLFLFDLYLHKYMYDIQKPAFCATSYMNTTSKLYKHWFPNYINPRVLCSVMSTVHTPTIQNTRLPPIIHLMLSINIHTSTHHSIKTHQNSRPS